MPVVTLLEWFKRTLALESRWELPLHRQTPALNSFKVLAVLELVRHIHWCSDIRYARNSPLLTIIKDTLRTRLASSSSAWNGKYGAGR